MGDSFIPRGLYAGTPAWLDMFEDITTVQFNHRMFAYLLVVLIGLFATLVYRGATGGRARLAVVLLLVVLACQVGLGISTLLLHVPVMLAVAHQGGAMLLLTATLFASHVLARQ
jgi:cytochrome c oxidase assembly protein subunit 15